MATVATDQVTNAEPEPEHPEPYRMTEEVYDKLVDAGVLDGASPFSMTVEVYDELVDAGVFGDKSPIYLWKGQLVLPMPKGPPHEYSQNVLLGILFRLIPDGWYVRPGGPTRLGDDSEPEPDLTVARGTARDYINRHPAAGDVTLAVEVSQSSRRFDQGEKLRAYAAEGIPTYWVVNIPENCIDVYTNPNGPDEIPGYGGHQRFHAGDQIPVTLDGREIGRIAVADILP